MMTATEMPPLYDKETLLDEIKEGIANVNDISIFEVKEITDNDLEMATDYMSEALTEFIYKLAAQHKIKD